MAKVTIGGQEHDIQTPFNFKKLKRAWPHMEKAAKAAEDDAMGALDAILAVIAIGLLDKNNHDSVLTDDQKALIAQSDKNTAYTVRLAALIDDLEERLVGPEVPDLKNTVFQIMSESGLIRSKDGGVTEGNAVGGEEGPEKPSTETLTPSSQNLSPEDVPEETGIG